MIRAALLLALTAIPAAAAPHLVCSLDQPVVAPDQPAAAALFTDTPRSAAIAYAWQATGGTFDPPHPTGRAATWRAAVPGAYQLTMQVTTGGVSQACTLHIIVSAATRGVPPASDLGSEAERDMLVRGSEPEPGYGLYSYILLGHRPDETELPRFRAVLGDYLRLEDVRLGAYFTRPQINATFVPVDAAPPEQPGLPWVLDHYDYERSRFLLARLRQDHPGLDAGGPYIVSALHPLGAAAAGPALVQDLSTVPLSVIPLWMQQFRSQTTQQRVWEKRSIASAALNLRTVIAVAAEGLPMAQDAVAKWIK